MRARVPDWVVWRIWWRTWVGGLLLVAGVASSELSSSSELLLLSARGSEVKASVVEGRERCEVTRWSDVGKWPVWKVDLCRRRDPASDFGSVGR